jgi:hypothetical protein
LLLSQYPHWRNYVLRSIRTTNSSTVGTFDLFDYSHYFTSEHCTLLTDVTSLTSYRTVLTMQAKQIRVYLAILVRALAMLRGGHTEALWSPERTAVLQQNVLAVIRQTTWKNLQYYNSLRTTWSCRCSCWSKLWVLKVISSEITVF